VKRQPPQTRRYATGVSVPFDPSRLRALYDSSLRTFLPLLPGVTVERDGPVLRVSGLGAGGQILYRDLGGLNGPDLDALIARQRDHFTARGLSVEWKLHTHDRPEDLPQRLQAAGFTPGATETVLVGLAAPLATHTPQLPEGVRVREATTRDDLERIAVLKERVSGGDYSRLVDGLATELTEAPTGLTVLVAEVTTGDNEPVVACAAWIRYAHGTEFATLWGGATLPEWRSRGLYRALVSHRARLARERGFPYLQVNASSSSRPILERLGFIPITTATPYVHTFPPAHLVWPQIMTAPPGL